MALATGLLVVLAAAPADARVAVAGPGAFAAGFATPVVITTAGGPLTLVNADAAPHNLIATDAFISKKEAKRVPWCGNSPKGKCPLFWSETIGAGEQTEVLGLERTESGKQYAFVCTLHAAMRGTLVTL